MNPSASLGTDAHTLNPFAQLRVGHLYLDVRTRRLHCLNETARELHREGMILTTAEQACQRLRTPAGEPVQAGDLPLLIAWQKGREAEASFVLRQEGKPDCHVLWSAAPVRNAQGQLIGVMACLCVSPPAFDWQALAGLAHDLRTPLHALSLVLSGLQNAAATEAQQQQLLEMVRSSAERALQIGRDLLLWCRGPAQAGRIPEFTWFPLAPFLDALAQEQMPAAQRKGLTLTTRVTAAHGWEIYADRVRMGRLLANLLVNAVRYTATGHVTILTEWRDDPAGRALVVSVVDTGTGISPEERESIFQPFERGRAGKGGDSSGGSGLGLAVVDRLVKELGLELEVYSEFGHGSAFHLVLPARLLRPETGAGA